MVNTEFYKQELRSTSTPGEFTMVYVKKDLTVAEKEELANLIAERQEEIIK